MIWRTPQHWHRAPTTLKTAEGDFSSVQYRHSIQVHLLPGIKMIPWTRLRKLRLETDRKRTFLKKTKQSSYFLVKTMDRFAKDNDDQIPHLPLGSENAEMFICTERWCIYSEMRKDMHGEDGRVVWYKLHSEWTLQKTQQWKTMEWNRFMSHVTDKPLFDFCKNDCGHVLDIKAIQGQLLLHLSMLLTSTWRWFLWDERHMLTSLDHRNRTGGWSSRNGRQACYLSVLILKGLDS